MLLYYVKTLSYVFRGHQGTGYTVVFDLEALGFCRYKQRLHGVNCRQNIGETCCCVRGIPNATQWPPEGSHSPKRVAFIITKGEKD